MAAHWVDSTQFHAIDQIAIFPRAGVEPVHGSTSLGIRSFSVNLDTGGYFCHKCQSHGNVLELWAAVHKLNLYEAALDLCRTLGRDVPWIIRW